MSEFRWYKGKYRVEVVLKSKGNWRVKALEDVPYSEIPCEFMVDPPPDRIAKGDWFTTVPRLLWRHPRK